MRESVRVRAHRLACVDVWNTRGVGSLRTQDEDDLLRGSDLNDVLSSPGIPVCKRG